MPFNIDAVEPTSGGGFSLLPDGDYDLVITKVEEKTSKKGYPMVNVTCEVQNNADYNGKKVFHNVTFLKEGEKGAGMSRHFLKCINQPFGAGEVDPQNWIGETFKAKISSRTYTKGDGNKATVNDIKEVSPSDKLAF